MIIMRAVFCIFAVLLFLTTKASDVKVEFITPKIVRVQWSADHASHVMALRLFMALEPTWKTI